VTLRAVAHERFAVIVVDTRRESIEGYETAKRIREESGTELTPIIFLTAFGGDELETAAAYASGAVDFVFTPVLAAVLRAKVSTFMKLVMRSQQLEDSVASILELNRALVDSEVRARAVLENVAEGIVTATEAGVIESVNPSALRQFGYDDEAEMIGQPFAAVVGATTGHRKHGSTFPMELGMSRMQIDGRMFTIGSVHDITGRSQRFERDRVAFEEAPIGSVITSRDGRIERVNQAICEMTGRTSEQLIGRRLSELAHPADRPASAAALAALVNGATGTRRFEGRTCATAGR
jgi:PAS domain-containing protein